MQDIIGNVGVVVVTYNATVFLESLSLNAPTIVYFDLDLWELRPDAVEFFDALKAVGIFHDSPRSAANFLNHIFSDIDLWWFRPEVQAAVRRFTSKYCRRSDDAVREYHEFISTLLVEKSS